MNKRIDGWTLIARIAAHPHKFPACEATAGLASMLLVRSQLVQGVSSQQDLHDLAAVVGPEPLLEVVENLAGYEALRVVDNIGWPQSAGGGRTTTAARRWLIAALRETPMRETSAREPEQPKPTAAPAAAPAASVSSRTLRGHRAMGAKRVRPAS